MKYHPLGRRPLAIYAPLGLFILALVTALVIGFSAHKNTNSTQQQLTAQQKALAGSNYADPILKYLPYGDIGYNITPVQKIINTKQELVLVISITLSGSDYRSTAADLQTSINSREQEALNYIEASGFNPSKYHIEYDVPSH